MPGIQKLVPLRPKVFVALYRSALPSRSEIETRTSNTSTSVAHGPIKVEVLETASAFIARLRGVLY